MERRARRRFLVGTLLGAVAALLFALSPLGLRLERLAVDRQAELLASRSVTSEDIVLVALDDASFDVLADEMDGLRWPYPRAVHARVLRHLLDAGARAIAVDVIFDLPSGYGPEDDAALAEVLRSGRIYLSYESSDQAVTPILSLFTEAGAVAANSALPVDIDGLIRYTSKAKLLPRTAMEELRYLAGIELPRSMADAPEGFGGLIGAALLGEAQSGILAFNAPGAEFFRIPYFEVYIPQLFERHRERIRDKVVFLGRAPSASITPQQQDDTDLTLAGFMTGGDRIVEHLQNLLDGSLRTVVSGLSALALLLGWGAAVMLGLNRFAQLSHALAFATVSATVWIAFSMLMFKLGTVVPVVFPIGLTVLPFVTAMAVRYLEERDARLITRAQLFHYLPPRVAEHVLKNTAQHAVAADRKEITLLFGDVAGFTSLSERESPELILSLLQTHLKDMAEVIFKHEGTLDKYIGDGIMAFWNAPEEQADHAGRAVSAAIEMLERVAEKNVSRRERGEPEMVLRIGLHTGEAIVGNIGSELFFDYTAIGDCVNTASRLEGANKVFGTCLLLSEEVQRRLPPEDAERVATMGRIALVGKTEPLEVYTVPAEGEEEFALLQDAIRQMDSRNLSGAKARLKEILTRRPSFLPAKFQLDQLIQQEAPSYDAQDRSYWVLGTK